MSRYTTFTQTPTCPESFACKPNVNSHYACVGSTSCECACHTSDGQQVNAKYYLQAARDRRRLMNSLRRFSRANSIQRVARGGDSPAVRADNLITAALRVVNEFDRWGEVLQSDSDGLYGPETAIEQLRVAAVRIVERPDYGRTS